MRFTLANSRIGAVRMSAVVTALMLLGSVVACGAKDSPQAAPPSLSTEVIESVEPSPSEEASIAPSPSKPSAAPPSYPKSAKDYAQALLNAWANKNKTRLNQLAVQAAVQQIADNGYPNSQWSHILCEGDGAGTTYCVFRNAHGDQAQIYLNETQLGHPTAVTQALLDRTSYPATAADYVGAFVNAWQLGNKQRMVRLSSSAVANTFGGMTPPTAYSTSIDGTAGHTKVSVNAIGNGDSFTVNVSNSKLGGANAIVGICDPTCA